MIKLYVASCKKENEHDVVRKLAEAGLSDLFKKSGELSHFDSGKPYFLGAEGVFVSLSHSGGLALAALSDCEIGVDTEPMNGNPDRLIKLAKRYFSPEEYEYAAAAPIPRFYEVWCAKESYMKYTAEGFSAGLSSFSTLTGEGLPSDVKFSRFEYRGHMVVICSREEWRGEITPLNIDQRELICGHYI